MAVFAWDDSFCTGFAVVDAQHRHLFELINGLKDASADAGRDEANLNTLFQQLAAYAVTHFKEEENLMRAAAVPAAYFEHHAKIHRNFVAQVGELWNQRGIMKSPSETIYGFLAAWLSAHILGEDQEMARQIRHARGEPENGLASAQRAAAMTPILQQALGVLYQALSRINRDLAETNRNLEAKVQERTQELLQAEKMASIGQLAAGVAHEINNPVGFVSSNLGTLGRYADQLLKLAELGAATPAGQASGQSIDLDYLKTDLHDLLRETREGLDRVQNIVANLKDFSRIDQSEWQEADLLAGLESTLNVAAHELKYKADLVRELAPLPRVRCMPAQLNQVFLNLLVNAAQAIAGHGTITVRSGTAGQEVWIEVADTGCGMDEATQRRMFEPFFTTKPVGTGTGLGMSLTWDIIKKHGGRIDVSSHPGAGTTIRVWLPVAGPNERHVAG